MNIKELHKQAMKNVADKYGYNVEHMHPDSDEVAQEFMKLALSVQHSQQQQHAVTVWFGSMPESNGRENWTVMLRRKAAPDGADAHTRHLLLTGFTVCRSEYKDRMRYEADRLRFLLGEIDKEPWILDYDADLHSGWQGHE